MKNSISFLLLFIWTVYLPAQSSDAKKPATIYLDHPNIDTRLKRGEIITVSWPEGAFQTEHLQIELYHKRTFIDVAEIPNDVNQYQWVQPKRKSGNNYAVRIIDPRKGDILASSGAFRIGRPGLIKWGISLTVGAAASSIYLFKQRATLPPPKDDTVPIR